MRLRHRFKSTNGCIVSATAAAGAANSTCSQLSHAHARAKRHFSDRGYRKLTDGCHTIPSVSILKSFIEHLYCPVMFGEAATELIRHITRDHGEIIPEYQHQLIEQIMKENDELYAENVKSSQSLKTDTDKQSELVESEANASERNQNGTTKPPEAENGSQDEDKEPAGTDNVDISEKEIMVMQVRHTAKLWNKRCILAYHYERLTRLKRLRWEYGNNLPREIIKNLSKDELDWFTRYSDNLFSYMSSLNDGKGLDLTLYLHPPKKLYIQVKCLRDYGQFDLEDGQPVMLKKDSIHYLPLSQCEKLIHQGVLEQTSL